MSVFSLALSLFLVFNAFGCVPIFLGLLSRYPEKKQRLIIVREFLVALCILLLFNFFGVEILTWIDICPETVGIAGGTLLFLIALGMIFPRNDHHEAKPQEPLIVPLAMPIIAGPGAISTIMVYAQRVGDPWKMLMIILIAWIPSFLILLASSSIKRFLGKRGLVACEKLGGMIVSLIAVQMISTGAIALLKNAFGSNS